MPTKYTPEQRFWSKVNKTDECWLWTASTTPGGYGTFWFENRLQPAHRVSYQMTYGAIPDGLQVCHRCDVRLCVRPDHLFLGTQADNMRDMMEKQRDKMHTHPERVATGLRNGAYTRPDRVRRGDTNGAHIHPERMARGERNGSARFTETQVREMRRMHAAGKTLSAIHRQFGGVITTIHYILTGVTWKHVK